MNTPIPTGHADGTGRGSAQGRALAAGAPAGACSVPGDDIGLMTAKRKPGDGHAGAATGAPAAASGLDAARARGARDASAIRTGAPRAVAGRWRAAALRLRAWLVPERLQLGWMPVYTLGYLVFLFLPMLFGYGDGSGRFSGGLPARSVVLTLLSVPVFLPLYFAGFRATGARAVACVLGIAVLGCALLPFNAFSNTYLIYAAGAAAMLEARLSRRAGLLAMMLAMFCAGVLLLGYPVFVFALTVVISVAVFVGNHLFVENARKRGALLLSHEEVRRLAAFAERERIGRDLHDLLGHALSMIALKSELAGKLLARDPDAALREVGEVARVARDTLAQVRDAVSGIRAPRLAAELASARLLLESAGIEFDYRLAPLPLPDEVETALALAVREAATNIQRHARARRASMSVVAVPAADGVDQGASGGDRTHPRGVRLRISDDGRGGVIVPGHGLAGMRERVGALGGQLDVRPAPGRGTCVEVCLPLPPWPV